MKGELNIDFNPDPPKRDPKLNPDPELPIRDWMLGKLKGAWNVVLTYRIRF